MQYPASNFPSRQKLLLILALCAGLFIGFSSAANFISPDTINNLMFFYSFGLPFVLLSLSTIIATHI
jgi:hypothetical protein